MNITKLRRGIIRLERERQVETGGKRKIKLKKLNIKYRVTKKGINMVVEKLNQRLIAKKSQFRKSQLFQVN